MLLSVGSGTHTVQIQAQTDTHSTAATGGVAISNAAYGPASVTIDGVRLVHFEQPNAYLIAPSKESNSKTSKCAWRRWKQRRQAGHSENEDHRRQDLQA